MLGIDSEITEEQLLQGLIDGLQELPNVQASYQCLEASARSDQRFDALVEFSAGNMTANLLIEVKKTVYPRDVRQTLWRLRESSSSIPIQGEDLKPVYFVLAHAISPGAKELLRHEQIGYYDSGGSLFLPSSNVFVYVDKSPPKSLSNSTRSLFTGRRARVLHAVLEYHREWFGVNDISREARVSSATASQVLTELEKYEWVVSRGKGPRKQRQLAMPSAMLDTWSEQLSKLRPVALQRFFVPLVRETLEEKLAESFSANNVEYAISHEAAAQRYAPYLSTVSQVHSRLVACPGADRALRSMEARPVSHGANLALIQVNSVDEMRFRRHIDGIWLASPVQVYLDLMHSEGRAKEMATHLRQECIGF